jgi:hypothetical protein
VLIVTKYKFYILNIITDPDLEDKQLIQEFIDSFEIHKPKNEGQEGEIEQVIEFSLDARPAPTLNLPMKSYKLSRGYFAIDFPGKPKANKYDGHATYSCEYRTEEGYEVKFTISEKDDATLKLATSQSMANLHFKGLEHKMPINGYQRVTSEYLEVNGFFAKKLVFKKGDSDKRLHVLLVLTKEKSYILSVSTVPETNDPAMIKAFTNSFEILN